MAQLYFYYSAMNAGKTTALLQSSYNYRERGMHTLIYTFEIHANYYSNHGKGIQVISRIGLKSNAEIFSNKTNFFSKVAYEHNRKRVHCVFIDECQFLNRIQVTELTNIVDELNIPVLCYGLRTDFRAELFTGSLWLLAWADKLIELKTICYCGRKANRVLRFDVHGQVTTVGNQIMIGEDHYYVSVCRKHFVEHVY